MQPYDLVFLGILGVSVFSGYMRGGITEIFNLISFFASLFISLMSMSTIQSVFKLDSLMTYIYAIILFFIIYSLIRLLGLALASKIQKQKVLNILNRTIGVGVGVLRSLVILGIIHLIISISIPYKLQPESIKDAKVYELGASCAKLIQTLVPQSTKTAIEYNEAI